MLLNFQTYNQVTIDCLHGCKNKYDLLKDYFHGSAKMEESKQYSIVKISESQNSIGKN